MAYSAASILFPTVIATTSIGICNLFARVSTILAPFVAELKPEIISESIYCTTCVIAFFASMLIIERVDDSEENEKEKEIELNF